MSKLDKTASSSKKQKKKDSSAETTPTMENIRGSQQSSKMKVRKSLTIPLHPLEQILGTTVMKSNGTIVNTNTLAVENGVIGLYFAAHWCPPCRMMSCKLALLYDEMKKHEKKFEVIFISFDYSEDSFSSYLSKMPWYAIDYSNIDKKEEIVEHFAVRAIPMLILLEAETCNVISLRGREILNTDPLGELFPWKQDLLTPANDTESLQKEPSVPGLPESKPISQTMQNKISETDNKIVEKTASPVGDLNKDYITVIPSTYRDLNKD